MKRMMTTLMLSALTTLAFSQVQFTRNGKISFFSSTSVEDIKAENNEVVSFLDTKKGELRFQVLIKGFIFPKAAMQQHFNGKDYMNSDVFPQSSFKGTITNLKEVNFAKDGSYKATVKGELTIHGETRTVETTGTIVMANGAASIKAVFKVDREDYKVMVPSFVSGKVSKQIEITVDCKYAPYKP